ncbi:hypothetical protein CHS0354_008289 [Potamilus streckersoni]|uniref:SEFIR domain-containing protein n=1 Tax=Potamilus streckersoni TaxID=2493646 RepID=A0AAE0RQY5_9BIVA|nr:hypothetical protein CHS0354_008289 [Potamilus streckersoni]
MMFYKWQITENYLELFVVSACMTQRVASNYPVLSRLYSSTLDSLDKTSEVSSLSVHPKNGGNQSGISVSWLPPDDGSIRFLRGFEVRLLGKSSCNLNKVWCHIIRVDNDNSSEIDLKTLASTAFETYFDGALGNFIVTVQSLPGLVSTASKLSWIATADLSCEVYHPNITVKTTLTRENATHHLFSFQPEIAEPEINKFCLELFNSSDILLTKRICTKKNFTWFQNLENGQYVAAITPSDPHPENKSSCICYTGPAWNRLCSPCRSVLVAFTISKEDSVNSADTIFPYSANGDAEDSPFKHIGIPVIGSFLAVTLLLIVWTVSWRGYFEKRLRIPIRSGEPVDAHKGQVIKGTLYLIYALDHQKHALAIEALASYLREEYGMNMNTVPISSTALEKIEQKRTKHEQDVFIKEAVDISNYIVIVHSKLAHHLYSSYKYGQYSVEGKPSLVNEYFLNSLKYLFKEDGSVSKRGKYIYHCVMDYTSNDYIIREILSSSPIRLMQDIRLLGKYLTHANKVVSFKLCCNRKKSSAEMTLCTAIQDASDFEKSNPTWFGQNYTLHEIEAQPDSGFVTSSSDGDSCIGILLGSETYRESLASSLDADFYTTHKGNKGWSLSYSKTRPFVLDRYSFIPPDEDVKETTESLLNTEIEMLNTRYFDMLSKLQQSESVDCITLDYQAC